MSTLPNSPMLLDSTGQVIAQKLQGIINALGGGGGTVIIEEYDSSVLRYPNTGETGGYTYKVGDYCSYNNSVYFCKTPIYWNETTPPAFDSTKWYDATDDIVTELSKKPGIVLAIPKQYGSSFIELFGNIGSHKIYNSGHDFTHVEGNNHTIGDSEDASKSAPNSHVEGDNNTIKAQATHAEGNYNFVYGAYSHVEGSNNTAGLSNGDPYTYGEYSHAEGYSNSVRSSYSHVEGSSNNFYENSNYSHVEGNSNNCYGTYNHLEGTSNNTDSNGACRYNHLEGNNNGIYRNSTTDQPAKYSHIEGSSNRIFGGENCHAEGNQNYCYSPFSGHVEGAYCYSNAPMSHAGGAGCYAGAYGRTDATGAFAHGQGVHSHNAGEAGFGKYNATRDARADISPYAETSVSYATGDKVRYQGIIYAANGSISAPAGAFDSTKWTATSNTYDSNPTLFTVGNGTSASNTSNAFEVREDGTGYLKNDKRIITTEEVPDPPTTDGTYTLQVTVNNGQLTYEWV